LDPLGRFLYGAEGGFNDLLGFLVNSGTGSLTPMPTSPYVVGNFPTASAIDASGRFAYVVNQNSNSISAFSVDQSTGALIPLPTSQVSTGANPVSITMTRKVQ
jgi:6-phosphogluconolactonase (cycloisomerase 2 family)